MRQRLGLSTGAAGCAEEYDRTEDWAVLDTRSVLVFFYGLEPTCGCGDNDDWRSAEVADKRKLADTVAVVRTKPENAERNASLT